MDTDDYRRNRQAVLDFVRLRKVEGLFALLRQIGVMLKGGQYPIRISRRPHVDVVETS